MHAFSAADLISPAIKRTKWFLFEQFRWTTYLKLCAVAVLTEGGIGGNENFSVPGGGHGGGTSSHSTPTIFAPHHFDVSPFTIAAIAAIAIVAIGISFVIFYLVTRLRFALFYGLVYRTIDISPGWKIYESQAWRFFLLSVGSSVLLAVALGLAALPFLFGFYRLYQSTQAGEAFNLSAFIGLLLPLIPIIILAVLIGIALHVVLHDLMLPHMALENASAGEAWRQARLRIEAEKGGFAVYALLRVILPIAAGILAVIAMLIPAIVLVAIFALPVGGLAIAAGAASGIAKLMFILLIGAIALIGIAILVLLGVCIVGPIGIGTRNYALLFYGGRYQALGNLLDPPPPTVSAPVPAV